MSRTSRRPCRSLPTSVPTAQSRSRVASLQSRRCDPSVPLLYSHVHAHILLTGSCPVWVVSPSCSRKNTPSSHLWPSPSLPPVPALPAPSPLTPAPSDLWKSPWRRVGGIAPTARGDKPPQLCGRGGRCSGASAGPAHTTCAHAGFIPRLCPGRRRHQAGGSAGARAHSTLLPRRGHVAAGCLHRLCHTLQAHRAGPRCRGRQVSTPTLGLAGSPSHP